MARSDRVESMGGGAPSGIGSRAAGRIKINSNPNKTAAKGTRNPTQKAWDREEANDPVYDKYGYPAKQTIKINSSNHQPRIGGHAS